jgi:hypothetical protein
MEIAVVIALTNSPCPPIRLSLPPAFVAALPVARPAALLVARLSPLTHQTPVQ